MRRGNAHAAPSAQAIVRTTAGAEDALARLQTVVHELAGVIGGSLRLLDMARAELGEQDGAREHAAEARRHVDAVRAAMAHVADLIRTAGRPGVARLSSHSSAISFAAAARHAIDVLSPAALDRGVLIRAEVDASLDDVPAGPIYSVIINALRNSIEAVHDGGTIELRARRDVTPPTVILEVLDDGPGPDDHDPARLFDHGYTTKPGSSGIGLALARHVIRELGGTISLSPRWPQRERHARGAALVASYPVPSAHTVAARATFGEER